MSKVMFKIMMLAVTLIILLAGCNSKQAKYYRFVEINGRYEITGRYPLSDAEGATMTCYHFIYNEEKKLASVEYLCNGKKSEFSYFGADVASVKIEYQPGFIEHHYLDIYGEQTDDFWGVSYRRLKLDENENPIAVFNYNKDGVLTKDTMGVTYYALRLDEKGRCVAAMRLDERGTRIYDSDGVYEVRYVYDKNDNKIETSSYGKDGQLMARSNNVATDKCKYDENNNLVELRYYGPDGQRVLNSKNGASAIKMKYNDLGLAIETAYYGTDDQLKECDEVAIYKYEYDKNGNQTSETYYGADNQIIEGSGHAKVQKSYDTHGNESQRSFYGIDGKLKEGVSGVATYKYKYDEYRRTIEMSKFDSRNRPVSTDGYSIERLNHDRPNRKTTKSYFDTENQKCVITVNGVKYHKIEYIYDKQDRLTEQRFYGTDDRLTEAFNGIAIVQWDYSKDEDDPVYIALDSEWNVVYTSGD